MPLIDLRVKCERITMTATLIMLNLGRSVGYWAAYQHRCRGNGTLDASAICTVGNLTGLGGIGEYADSGGHRRSCLATSLLWSLAASRVA